MSKTRVYQNRELGLKQTITLDPAASHHLSRVLRLSVGDVITIFNGEGGEYHGAITNLDRKLIDVELQSFSKAEKESPLRICLVQGLARGEKMDFIVQKAVELGVASIQPVSTAFGNVKLSKERAEKRLKHWQLVAISACEQSGRTLLPEILHPMPFKDWLQMHGREDNFMLCPHTESVDLSTYQTNNQKLNLLVGPEGGFSSDEVSQAINLGVKPLCLGPRILRTETAPLAAISVFQYQFGDF